MSFESILYVYQLLRAESPPAQLAPFHLLVWSGVSRFDVGFQSGRTDKHRTDGAPNGFKAEVATLVMDLVEPARSESARYKKNRNLSGPGGKKKSPHPVQVVARSSLIGGQLQGRHISSSSQCLSVCLSVCRACFLSNQLQHQLAGHGKSRTLKRRTWKTVIFN